MNSFFFLGNQFLLLAAAYLMATRSFLGKIICPNSRRLRCELFLVFNLFCNVNISIIASMELKT